MKYSIVTYGNPVLRHKAEPVPDVNRDVLRLADDMLETMYGDRGLGLAAEQIGMTKSVCVIDIPPDCDVEVEGGPRLNPLIGMPLVMVNPHILSRSGAMDGDEGCLSFPKIFAPVRRAAEVTVVYNDIKGERRIITVKGLLARAVQHELDHLNGVLLVDRMSAAKRIGLSGALKRMKKAGASGS